MYIQLDSLVGGLYIIMYVRSIVQVVMYLCMTIHVYINVDHALCRPAVQNSKQTDNRIIARRVLNCTCTKYPIFIKYIQPTQGKHSGTYVHKYIHT